MGVQVLVCAAGSSYTGLTNTIYFPIMNFLAVFLPILILINVVKTETFADKLAIFVSDTPNGYTVSQMVKTGENCHCRVQGSYSSSSSSQLAPTTVAGSSTFTTEADTTSTTETATTVTTEADTTTDATTTTGGSTTVAGDTFTGSVAGDSAGRR